MELKPLLGNTWYCDVGTASVAVYFLSPQSVVLIDSGTEESQEFLDLLGSRNLTVRAVIQTHLHIDHIGCNKALVNRYRSEVFASEPELPDAAFWKREFTYPITVNQPGETISVDGYDFVTHFTPGHTLGHQAILTPDGVLCLGDALMSIGRLKTAKVPFMRDVTESLISLERIRELNYPMYLAAHLGPVSPEILNETIEQNIRKELELYDLLRRIVTEPISISALEKKFMEAAGIKSPRVMAFRFMHISSNTRIMELVRAGEFQKDGDMIIPNKPQALP